MEWIKISERESELISGKVWVLKSTVNLFSYRKKKCGRVLSIYKGAASWENGWSRWDWESADCYSIRLEDGVHYIWKGNNPQEYNFLDNFYKAYWREERLKYILRF